MASIKMQLRDNRVLLPLYRSQGGIRIADMFGNHVSSPTKAKNELNYFVEWMITNDEIKLLTRSFLDKEAIKDLITAMNEIKKFIEESEYSKRKTVKVDEKKIGKFEDFEIFGYNESFFSFERVLNSHIKVRITFKLGDFGLEPHAHMYVLIPFNHPSIRLKNREGDVSVGKILDRGCFSEWCPTVDDIKRIIVSLAYASRDHRDTLVNILNS